MVLLSKCFKKILIFAGKYPQRNPFFLISYHPYSVMYIVSNFFYLFSTISILIAGLCIMGTLIESLKVSCVRKEPYKILVEAISDPPEENDGMSNNQFQVIDEKMSQDISMHGVTVLEKGWCFSIKAFAPSLFLFI